MQLWFIQVDLSGPFATISNLRINIDLGGHKIPKSEKWTSSEKNDIASSIEQLLMAWRYFSWRAVM